MAKIYETKEDAERDKLKEQAKDLHNETYKNFQSGLLDVALAVGSRAIDTTANNQGKWWSKTIFLVFAGQSLFYGLLGLKSYKDAQNTEAKLAKLGPETIIYPPGVMSEDMRFTATAPAGATFQDTVVSDGKNIHHHLKKVPIEPTLLLEQAEKSADSPLSKG